jgi:asparagine synthase (glutamine-hydrolysing)
MCGFAGFLSGDLSVLGNPEYVVTNMALAIAHRGPDDAGAWVDLQAGIAFGHRRLSIVDLSNAGHQPMHSASGHFVIAFNGEIYNHMEMRAEIETNTSLNTQWRGSSDTETLLAAFENWGVEATLKKSVGMFSFALWDVQQKTLTLARDRLGEKPLYYGWVGTGNKAAFLFGSELKALRIFNEFDNNISREALACYMQYTHVPAPYSIYQNIYKLEPGCLLTIKGGLPPLPNQLMRPHYIDDRLELKRWWSMAEVVEAGAQNMILDETQALNALEQRVNEAISNQMLADVPIGAFLSGGIDSSAIVSLMQQQSPRAIKTFTVGFEEADFDESSHARAIAAHLGTDHSELIVTSKDATSVIPLLSSIYDEPFADSSQIPTYLLCRVARQKVKVALSGDAGDELFGGYNRYFWGPRIWRRLAWLPYPARQMMSKAILTINVENLDEMGRVLGVHRAGKSLHKLASSIEGVFNLDDLYRSLVSEWKDPSMVVKLDATRSDMGIHSLRSMYSDLMPRKGVETQQLQMMYRDTMTYLPNDILCKVDRAAMAASLETRMPFLDHRVVEIAWQLPLNLKIRGKERKWALKQILYKNVPQALFERPKSGFGIPLGEWLRGPLREWAENLLEKKRLEIEGFFYSEPICQKWKEHLSGTRDHTASLWTVLMFQAWLEETS